MSKRIRLVVVAASLCLASVGSVAMAPSAAACSEEVGGTACTTWFVCQVTKGKLPVC